MTLKQFLKPASLLLGLVVLAGCQSLPKERVSQTHKSTKSGLTTSLAKTNYSPAKTSTLADIIKNQSTTDTDTSSDDTSNQEESPIFHQNLWRYIADNLELSDTENDRVQNEVNWFVDHPRYLEVSAERASPYLYFIVEQLEAKDIPLDLALVPMVESSFNPFANSPAQAAGIWQIIPGTGRRFGLEQNFWYDGRRDIKEATRAALEYLTYLKDRYNGDWLLAMAAYNSGEGTVDRAVNDNLRKSLPIDYWSLRLPRETMAYVPKILALGKLIRDPQHYGLNSPNLPNQPYLETVDIDQQISLAYAAELANIDFNQLKRLNPGFSRDATSPGTNSLLLPKENASQLREQMDTLMDKGRVNWLQYQVRRGDNLKNIAAFYEVGIEQIRQMNRLKGQKLSQGSKLLIPVPAGTAEYFQQKLVKQLALEAETALKQQQLLAERKSKEAAKKSDKQLARFHKVGSGDSLWRLSQQYKISVDQLAKINQLKPGTDLKPGQNLVIQSQTATASNKAKTKADLVEAKTTPPKTRITASISQKIYKVGKGDSLAAISNKLKVDLDDLKRWNKLDKNSRLKPGQELTYSLKPKG